MEGQLSSWAAVTRLAAGLWRPGRRQWQALGRPATAWSESAGARCLRLGQQACASCL